jgi:Tol biopolymer transport system component
MTASNKKQLNFLTYAGITAFAALTLSACGTDNIDLSGAAGAPAQTEAPVSGSTEEAPATEAPPTPIPPATGRIIFASNRDGQNDLYITSPDGIEITRLTTNAALDSSSTPRLSPDGTMVAFSSTVNGNTDIYLLEIASGAIRRVTDALEKDSSPSWSPNGQQLAFESFRDGNLEIYIVNADGSNLTRLTNDPSGDSNPVWSPISNEIIFVSGRFGNSDLLLVTPNGNISTLTTSPTPENTPAWSPDGSTIAYAAFTGELSDICLIGRDGSNQNCITQGSAVYSAPAWSQNGEWIAVSDPTSVHVYNIKDNSFMQLSQPGIEPRGNPAWSPDGLRLVFQAESGGDMELYHAHILTNEFIRVTSISGYDGKPLWASR